MPPSHRAHGSAPAAPVHPRLGRRFGSCSGAIFCRTFRGSFRAALTLALLLPVGGCCSLARLFCGPDRTPWVSIDYTTHAAALATFMEAVRRDRPDVLFDSLSRDFRQAQGIPGKAEMAVVWEKLQQQITGLHMIGYAEVSAPARLSPTRVRYVLTVAGHSIGVELVRLPYWNVAYEYEGERRDHGRYAPLAPVLRVAQDEQTSLRLTLDDLPLAIDEESVIQVQAGQEWKIDRVEQIARAEPDVDAFDEDAGGP